jgi:hypothetical protein
MTAQPDITGLIVVYPAPGENGLHALEDAPDASSNSNKPPPLAKHRISPSQDDASSSDSHSNLPAPEGDVPELRPSDADFERLFASPTPTAADTGRTQRYLTMSARRWVHDNGANISLGVDNTILRCVDDFIWQQAMTHGGSDQGMLACPSDEDTETSESSPQDPEISIYQITTTDRDAFHDEE